MSNQLLPCPFCGGDAGKNEHTEDCYFTARQAVIDAEKGDVSGVPEMLRAWNRRATQPAAGEPEQQTAINADDLPTKKYPLGAFDFDAPVAAGEPVAWAMWADGRVAGVTHHRNVADSWVESHDAQALGVLAPAAAPGDEAVRIGKLLDLADQHAERRLADARSDEAAAAELESSEEDEAGNWYGACIGAADTARASAAIIKSLVDEIRSLAAMRAQAGEGGA